MARSINDNPLSRLPNDLDWQAWAPLGSVAIWTGNTIVTKMAATVIEPTSIAFYRWLLAFLILLPFVGPSAWAHRRLIRANWRKLFVLGILGMGLYQGLAYEAARTTTAVHMGVILALMPLASTLVASVLAKEALTMRMMAGIASSVIGISIVIAKGQLDALFTESRSGDLLMVIAILS